MSVSISLSLSLSRSLSLSLIAVCSLQEFEFAVCSLQALAVCNLEFMPQWVVNRNGWLMFIDGVVFVQASKCIMSECLNVGSFVIILASSLPV